MRPYIDLHCDTLMQALMAGQQDVCHFEKAMVDVDRLQQGGCLAQFFAIFMPPLSYRAKLGDKLPDDDTYIRLLHGILMNTINQSDGRLALARSAGDLAANRSAGKCSAFLTIEDGRPVEGRMEKLEKYYDLGIRLISLTWNDANCFGFPNSQNPQEMALGLTPFGKDAVQRMQELGMLVDVSHLSDGGFWDVAKLCKKPFVASHSNCRALNPHPRSMSDEMIRTLADHGGVMGVNFGPQFLTGDIANQESRISDIMAHVRHMIDVGGVGCVAIGTDFDGVSGQLEISSAHQVPLLFQAMEQAGFTATEIDALAEKNILRLLSDTLS